MAANHQNATPQANNDQLALYPEWNSSLDSMMLHDFYDLEDLSFGANLFVLRLLFGLFLTFMVIFILNGIVLLLTSLSPQCRCMSPSWYLYHLNIIRLLDFTIVLPLKLSGTYETACSIVMILSASFDILQAISVIFINVEIVFTVISPRSCWKRSSKKRFIIANFISWIACLVFVLTGSMFGTRGHCFAMHVTFEIFRLAFCYWLVGVAAIIFPVIAVVYYRKARSSGVAYNQFIDDSGTAIKPKEWLICLLIIDCIYAFGHVVLNHLEVIAFYHAYIFSLCSMILNASLIFSMYSLSRVRSSISNGFMWLLGLLWKRKKPESHARMTSSGQAILGTDAMDDNEL